MARVIINFPSAEMANLFASTIAHGEFAKMMNRLSEQEDHNEFFRDYLEDTIKWDEKELGNHIIDLTDSLE